MKLYRTLCYVAAAALIYSFVQHLLNAGATVDMGLEASLAAQVVARRMSIFPLGLAAMLILSTAIRDAAARFLIGLSAAIIMVAYAGLGIYELAIGTVNMSMLVPVIIELVLGGLFLVACIRMRRAQVPARR